MRWIACLALLVALAACRSGTRAAAGPVPRGDAPGTATEATADGLVRVPDVRGIPSASAIALLRAVGLAEGDVFPGAELRDFPPGTVAAQEPRSGTRVPPGTRVVLEVAPTPSGGDADRPPDPAPDPASPDALPAPAPPQTPAPGVAGTDVAVPSLLDLTPPVARRALEDLGLAVRLATAGRGSPGLVVDQRPLPGERVARGGEVTIYVGPMAAGPEGPAPTPAAEPDPDFPDIPAGPDAKPPPPAPAPPALPPLPIPAMLTPADQGVIRGGANAVVIVSWTPAAGATGYLFEVEERTGETWTPILQKVVATTDVPVEITPANGVGGEFRWRVRTVAGKRGGRAAPWWTFTLR